MVRLGMVIFMGAIIASMAAAIYTYTLYQTNYIESVAGEIVKVGPVEYVLTFEGTSGGSKEVTPENVFVMVGITAKNVGDEETLLSGRQFYIIDEKDQKHKSIYGKFSAKDLLTDWLKPDELVERTTQFDIPFDEEKRYEIIIRPEKIQSSVDTAVVCITNC